MTGRSAHPRARSWRGASTAARVIALVCLILLGLGATSTQTLGQIQGQDTPSAPLSASRSAKNIAIISIHGPIDRWTAYSVKRRIDKAVNDGADALVFEIDTPGGEVWAVLTTCSAIKSSQIGNTTAWVRSQAFSGGAIIGLACKEMVVTPSAAFGDALPVAMNPLTGGLDAMPEAEREKIMGPLLAEVTDSARRNSYDEMLVQRLVRRGIELWRIRNQTTGEVYFATEAEVVAATGVSPQRSMPSVPSYTGPVDGVRTDARQPSVVESSAETQSPVEFRAADPSTPAQTIREVNTELELLGTASTRPNFRAPEHAGKYQVLEYVGDGHGILMLHTAEMLRFGLAVQTVNSESDLVAYFGAQNVVRLDENWSEGLARFLTLGWVRGLLIAVFLICLFVEMTHPGLTAPGIVAVIALLTLIIPPALVNMAAWWEIAAILVGVVLILMELFVIPGFGVCGVLGVVLLMGGLVGTFVGGGGIFPDTVQERSELTAGLVTVLVSAFASGGVMYLLAKHLPSTPLIGRLVLKDAVQSESETTLLQAMSDADARVKVGAVGRAVTPLRPAGRVLFEDQILDAVAEYGFIDTGATVRVVSADAFRIGVEHVTENTPGTPGERSA